MSFLGGHNVWLQRAFLFAWLLSFSIYVYFKVMGRRQDFVILKEGNPGPFATEDPKED
jgi:hypothetical protein